MAGESRHTGKLSRLHWDACARGATTETGQPVLDREGKPGRSVDVSVNGARFEPGEVSAAVVVESGSFDDELPF